MIECEKCCGTCQYGAYGRIQGYVCTNDESEYVADFVEENHTCEDWSENTEW